MSDKPEAGWLQRQMDEVGEVDFRKLREDNAILRQAANALLESANERILKLERQLQEAQQNAALECGHARRFRTLTGLCGSHPAYMDEKQECVNCQWGCAECGRLTALEAEIERMSDVSKQWCDMFHAAFDELSSDYGPLAVKPCMKDMRMMANKLRKNSTRECGHAHRFSTYIETGRDDDAGYVCSECERIAALEQKLAGAHESIKKMHTAVIDASPHCSTFDSALRHLIKRAERADENVME